MYPNAYIIRRLTSIGKARALTMRESIVLERAIEREDYPDRDPRWPEHPGQECDCPTCRNTYGALTEAGGFSKAER